MAHAHKELAARALGWCRSATAGVHYWPTLSQCCPALGDDLSVGLQHTILLPLQGSCMRKGSSQRSLNAPNMPSSCTNNCFCLGGYCRLVISKQLKLSPTLLWPGAIWAVYLMLKEKYGWLFITLKR